MSAMPPIKKNDEVFVLRGKDRGKTGRVLIVLPKDQKIVVEVRRRVAHPVYKRIVTKHSKFMAHDEHGKAHEGDMVRIVETRPLSKNKRWSLKEVIRASTTGV